MTDQGWMVDDGTCTSCVYGNHHRCTKPIESYDGEGFYQTCCCNEGYGIGYVEVDP
jgi:hypothetical protein